MVMLVYRGYPHSCCWTGDQITTFGLVKCQVSGCNLFTKSFHQKFSPNQITFIISPNDQITFFRESTIYSHDITISWKNCSGNGRTKVNVFQVPCGSQGRMAEVIVVLSKSSSWGGWCTPILEVWKLNSEPNFMEVGKSSTLVLGSDVQF
jgi:hypothetical protein